MLLGHLIALISNAHLRKAGSCEALCGRFRSFLLLLGMVNTAYRKTSLHRDRPKQSLRLASSYRTALAGADDAPHRMRYPMPSDDADWRPAFRAYPFFTMSRNRCLDSGTVSLRVGRFLRSRSGGARRDRTDDLLLAKQALSQLSYGPVSPPTSRRPSRHPISQQDPATKRMVGLERFELSTSRLSSARSNQLSYRPGKRGGRPNEERETKAAVSRRHFAEPV